MTHTPTPSESQANLTIPELISAIAGVQAIIAANVKSPFLDDMTHDHLGQAYCFLAQTLSQRAIRLKLEI